MTTTTLSAADKDRIARVAAKCRYDPLLWMETAWDWGVGTLKGRDIRAWQADIADQIAQHLADPETRFTPLRIAVASGHGIGKSAGMGMLSNWAMTCWRGARVVITANTENQLRTKTSPEVGTWFNRSISGPLFDVDTLSIKPKEQTDLPWAMDFVPWSVNNTEAFAGLHAEGRLIMLLMDEASAIDNKIWEVAEGAMTDANTIIIFIVFGNPTRNVGRFRECFRRFRHLWKTRQIDSRDVEGTNKKFLQELVDTYGENSDLVKVRVRGMFPSASSRQLIPTHLVDGALGKHLAKSSYDFAPSIITCDPAWTGEDELVIAHRKGLMFEVLEVMEKNDNDYHVARKLAHYEDKYAADGVFIDFGYGTGIKSAGDVMGRKWDLVNFSESAPVPGYVNMRAFMWDSVRQWLEEGAAIPDDPVLYEDLIGVETKPTMNGAIQLLSKEDMKKLGLPSPNRGDALALSFARPVVSKRKPLDEAYRSVLTTGAGKYRTNDGDYDPHG